ncbi:hypothetical protein [Nocardioides pyridinolyticus]
MYENNLNRDLLKSEMDYRVGRVRDQIAGRRRRRRRTLVRRGDAGDVGWTTVR